MIAFSGYCVFAGALLGCLVAGDDKDRDRLP